MPIGTQIASSTGRSPTDQTHFRDRSEGVSRHCLCAFFKGVMTAGPAPGATDDAVRANIVAAGYGR